MNKNKIISTYGVSGLIRLFVSYIYTKVIFPSSRIIRLPLYVRGKKYIRFGHNLTTGVNLRIDAFPKSNGIKYCIKFGDNVQLNDYVHIGAIDSIEIGNNVLIASKVFITDHNHGYYGGMGVEHTNPNEHPIDRPLSSSPVVIGDDVWIGEFVSILPGVSIGKGSVIGAMSLVNKDIPAYSIAVGIPAEVIKFFNFESKQWESVR